MLKIVNGDILDGSYQYIAHQCYAIAGRGGGGLAAAMFNAHKGANAYTGVEHDVGSISVHKPVINMFTQRYPGKPAKDTDTAEMRLGWFRKAIFTIGKQEGIKQVAFPYLIGCGLAGGYWLEYEDLLLNFAEWTDQEIIIVRLKGDS